MTVPQPYTPSLPLGRRYRYGFNGKELDPQGMGGGGSTYDYGFRIYNAQLGRFLSVDPLCKSYPWYTPYQFAGVSPIWAIDLDGLEQAVVVRWYDSNDQCTGQTIFLISNPNDRPLGNTVFLFMNIPDTPSNKNTIERLGYQVSRGVRFASSNAFSNFLNANTQGSGAGTLTDFQGNPVDIISTGGGLVTGNAFTRNSLCQSDRLSLQNVVNVINQSPQKGVIDRYNLEEDIIHFSDASSTYDPNLDIDNDGKPNSLELSQAIAKLLSNPDKIALISGNTSIEDKNGGINNQDLSNQRSQVVFNLISSRLSQSGGVNTLINQGGLGSMNANPDPNLNMDGKESTNRNATISYDIPRQSQ